MIACSIVIEFAVWALFAGSVITTIHLIQTDRRHFKLRQRVHHLEMEQDFPGYWQHEHDQIERDRWSR